MTADVAHPPGTEHPRRRRQLNWELIACGVSGHMLVARHGERIVPDDELVIRDRGDVRWHRCLRCDAWVPLPRPPESSPARTLQRAEIAVPLRGRALHDRVVLRLIALDRLTHFLILGLLGAAVLVFDVHRGSLRGEFYRVLTAIQGGVAGGPVQSSGHVGIAHDLDRLFSLQSSTLTELGIALLAYGALEGVEAIGLWLAKRWAEYLTFVSTTILLPLEIYELAHTATVLKAIGFVINLAVVVYLLLRKRLFGLRGGGAADDAERRRDMGWAAVQRATPPSLSAPVAEEAQA